MHRSLSSATISSQGIPDALISLAFFQKPRPFLSQPLPLRRFPQGSDFLWDLVSKNEENIYVNPKKLGLEEIAIFVRFGVVHFHTWFSTLWRWAVLLSISAFGHFAGSKQGFSSILQSQGLQCTFSPSVKEVSRNWAALQFSKGLFMFDFLSSHCLSATTGFVRHVSFTQ